MKTCCVWVQKGLTGIALWIQVGSYVCQELAASGNFDSTIHINIVHLGIFVQSRVFSIIILLMLWNFIITRMHTHAPANPKWKDLFLVIMSSNMKKVFGILIPASLLRYVSLYIKLVKPFNIVILQTVVKPLKLAFNMLTCWHIFHVHPE